MTDPTKVDSTDARQASMSRVQTQDTLLASLAGPASEDPPKDEPKDDDKQKDGEQKPAKKSPQERIVELAHKRKEAEAKAEAAEVRNRELEAQLQALKAQAQPIEATTKPVRASYASEDDFIEALTDWKSDQAVAKRERQHAEARQQAEFAEVVQQWDSRQKKAIESIPDYAETLANAEINIRDYVHSALLESEKGPEIAYYLALHPEEAKRLNAMKPLAAIKRIASLESDLSEPDDDAKPEPKVSELPKKSKAPEPINPVKGVGASNPGKAESYEEYRRRRLGK
jgi:hypothetical protein